MVINYVRRVSFSKSLFVPQDKLGAKAQSKEKRKTDRNLAAYPCIKEGNLESAIGERKNVNGEQQLLNRWPLL